MIHRAVLGSFERFIGILIENYAGKLPFWLAPQQVVIASIVSDANDYALEIQQSLKDNKIRCEVDLRNEKISYKVREHSSKKVPIILAIGKKEMADKTVSLRRIGSKESLVLSLDDAIKDIIKETGNEYATLASDGVTGGDVDSFIDTGSYAFNALLSGSIFGGLPGNRITAIAGEAATGKTFFVLGCVRQFLADNPSGGVIYFESESAISKDMVESRDIDSSRMVILPVATVQEFRTQAVKVLEKHMATDESERPPLMLCLDSLGMLSTSKEVEDTSEGKDTRDMTRAQVIRGAFRVLTLMLGKAKVPMLVTNHTYCLLYTSPSPRD